MAGGSGGNFAGGLADSPLTLTLTANSSTGVSAAASTGAGVKTVNVTLVPDVPKGGGGAHKVKENKAPPAQPKWNSSAALGGGAQRVAQQTNPRTAWVRTLGKGVAPAVANPSSVGPGAAQI